MLWSLRHGARAGDDPWDAWTLEWATTSPPPAENFAQVPPVRSRRPLWDLKHPEDPDWSRAAAAPATKAGLGMTVSSRVPLGVLFFLASEAVFFSLLILAYVYYQGGGIQGPTAAGTLSPLRTGLFSVALFSSSFTVWRAGAAFRRGRQKRLIFWLVATIVLGAIFLVGQAHEYADLLSKQVAPSSNQFATTFFTLTGMHGLHVFVGLIFLGVLCGLSLAGHGAGLHPRAWTPSRCTWHFVDIVWVFIFSVVYIGGAVLKL